MPKSHRLERLQVLRAGYLINRPQDVVVLRGNELLGMGSHGPNASIDADQIREALSE